MRNKLWVFVWSFILGWNAFFVVYLQSVIHLLAALIAALILLIEWRLSHGKSD